MDDLLYASLLEAERLCSYYRRVDQVESKGVTAILLHHDRRIWVVLQALRHLLAVFCKHYAIDDTVLERHLPEEVSTQNYQGIEPTSSLVEALGNEVSREAILKLRFILEGVMLTSERHAS